MYDGLKSVLYALKIKTRKLKKKKTLVYFFQRLFATYSRVFFYFVLYTACLTVLNLNLRALVSRLSIGVHSRRYCRGGRIPPPPVCVCVFSVIFSALSAEKTRFVCPFPTIFYHTMG